MYVFVLQLLRFIAGLRQNQISKVISDQLIRSGTSVLANFVEAKSSSSRKDFTNFFTHALKSANESKMWIALLRDTGNGEKAEIETLLQELIQIADILASSILTLKGKKSI